MLRNRYSSQLLLLVCFDWTGISSPDYLQAFLLLSLVNVLDFSLERELQNISPFLPKKTETLSLESPVRNFRCSICLICNATTFAAPGIARIGRITQGNYKAPRYNICWGLTFLAPVITVHCLFIYLLMKAVKCMEVQQLWQVGNERGQHETRVTKVFLKHLY